ncbi:SDR family NAD(P)-dependent oxidoreductase [Paracidovorax konjaci]|uniref:NAD(P)-dependent dehydrogenase, short-chain alcohol dehydrogenase family n=1 Tax=Paracidovorax konjaci TaxID=32040 RepID=A0A1I1XYV0_9BURK|nr:SDR family oxidoreductase [Paracidovorax konjaci]SFE12464.1 NAD(P)-dependent dehydrogenase, short-chain alcohol dehydrogenase family [Paracidovorax konjaci]
MHIDLSSLRVVIAGGTRGIGLAIAERLADEGCCHLAVCGREAMQLSLALGQLRRPGLQATGESLDIADTRAVRAWVARTAGQWGGLDVFIGNAAAMLAGRDDAGWQQELAVSLIGLVAGADAAVPFLKASRRASMVFINSLSGQEIGPQATAYNAAKAGLLAHAKGLAHECGPHGIRVNTVTPGAIYDPYGHWGRMEQHHPAHFAQVRDSNPLRRLGTPADIAKAVAFLVSDAASYINGANLLVDGGASCRPG